MDLPPPERNEWVCGPPVQTGHSSNHYDGAKDCSDEALAFALQEREYSRILPHKVPHNVAEDMLPSGADEKKYPAKSNIVQNQNMHNHQRKDDNDDLSRINIASRDDLALALQEQEYNRSNVAHDNARRASVCAGKEISRQDDQQLQDMNAEDRSDEALAFALQEQAYEYSRNLLYKVSHNVAGDMPSTGASACAGDAAPAAPLAHEKALERSTDARRATVHNMREAQNGTIIMSDEALALALQQDDAITYQPPQKGKDMNFSTASFYADEKLAVSQAAEERESAMGTMAAGKAWKFAEQIRTTLETIAVNMDLQIENLQVDDILFMAERTFEAQAAFAAEGKKTVVDIGYHYTRPQNLTQITENGLLTKAERSEKSVVSNFNGSAYGDGVYTGNDPYSYSTYGEVGLFVARLQGSTTEFNMHTVLDTNFDTIINNQDRRGTMVILGASYQCIPLARFSRLSRQNEATKRLLLDCHCKLQEVVDECFNNGTPTMVHDFNSMYQEPEHSAVYLLTPTPTHQHPTGLLAFAKRPQAFVGGRLVRHRKEPHPTSRATAANAPLTVEVLEYVAPAENSTSSKNNPKPSGSMRISMYKAEQLSCQGHGTIVIVYSMGPSRHHHTIAFLPQNDDGCRVLEWLKGAFRRGLTFDSSGGGGKLKPKLLIPHKNSPYCTSFPDPKYFAAFYEALNDGKDVKDNSATSHALLAESSVSTT